MDERSESGAGAGVAQGQARRHADREGVAEADRDAGLHGGQRRVERDRGRLREAPLVDRSRDHGRAVHLQLGLEVVERSVHRVEHDGADGRRAVERQGRGLTRRQAVVRGPGGGAAGGALHPERRGVIERGGLGIAHASVERGNLRRRRQAAPIDLVEEEGVHTRRRLDPEANRVLEGDGHEDEEGVGRHRAIGHPRMREAGHGPRSQLSDGDPVGALGPRHLAAVDLDVEDRAVDDRVVLAGRLSAREPEAGHDARPALVHQDLLRAIDGREVVEIEVPHSAHRLRLPRGREVHAARQEASWQVGIREEAQRVQIALGRRSGVGRE